jgi:hypothetical protein
VGGVEFFGTGAILKAQDDEAIAPEPPGLAAGAPVVRARTKVIHRKREWVPVYIYGTTPAFLQIRDWQTLAEGRSFTDHEVRDGSPVCLLGATLARELFGQQSPVGVEVRVEKVNLNVTGVLGRKGANAMWLDQDDILVAPWTPIKAHVSGANLANGNQSAPTTTTDPKQQVNSLNQLYPGKTGGLKSVDQILAQARSVKDVTAAIRQVRELLRQRHRIAASQADDFIIRDMQEPLKALSGK